MARAGRRGRKSDRSIVEALVILDSLPLASSVVLQSFLHDGLGPLAKAVLHPLVQVQEFQAKHSISDDTVILKLLTSQIRIHAKSPNRATPELIGNKYNSLKIDVAEFLTNPMTHQLRGQEKLKALSEFYNAFLEMSPFAYSNKTFADALVIEIANQVGYELDSQSLAQLLAAPDKLPAFQPYQGFQKPSLPLSFEQYCRNPFHATPSVVIAGAPLTITAAFNKINEKIETLDDKFVALAWAIVLADKIDPPEGVQPVQDYLTELAKSAGFDLDMNQILGDSRVEQGIIDSASHGHGAWPKNIARVVKENLAIVRVKKLTELFSATTKINIKIIKSNSGSYDPVSIPSAKEPATQLPARILSPYNRTI